MRHTLSFYEGALRLKQSLFCWTVSIYLNGIDHGADGIFCDVIQAHLKGGHHHASLQLAPCGQQQSVGAETQLFLLTSPLPRAEWLGGAQRILRLETMLKDTQASERYCQSTVQAHNCYLEVANLAAATLCRDFTF